MQQQLKFRITDLNSFAVRRANEDAVVLAALRAGRGPFGTPATCHCGRPREAVRVTPGGHVLLGCRGEGDHEHLVATTLAAAGASWPRAGFEFDYNSAVAYGVARCLDVPARFRGCVAGPVLIGGGTVYLPGDEFPTYSSDVKPAAGEPAWDPSGLVDLLYRDLVGRFQTGIDPDPIKFPEPVVQAQPEEFVEVRPQGRPKFRKRGAA